MEAPHLARFDVADALSHIDGVVADPLQEAHDPEEPRPGSDHRRVLLHHRQDFREEVIVKRVDAQTRSKTNINELLRD